MREEIIVPCLETPVNASVQRLVVGLLYIIFLYNDSSTIRVAVDLLILYLYTLIQFSGFFGCY